MLLYEDPARKDLLDVSLPYALLIQILNKLLRLHPVSEWADITTVPKERSARQVDGTSCGTTGDRRIVELDERAAMTHAALPH